MALNYLDIEKAVNGEKDTSGFAKLMQDFQTLGVLRYDYLVADGLYRFFDNDSHVDLRMNGIPKPVLSQGDPAKIKAAVKDAQAGKFDFEQFCLLAGEAGVATWTSYLQTKKVTYYDQQHQALLIEPIPGL